MILPPFSIHHSVQALDVPVGLLPFSQWNLSFLLPHETTFGVYKNP
jgi:hypothetical protein